MDILGTLNVVTSIAANAFAALNSLVGLVLSVVPH